jgi:hypothetical protein
MAKLSGKRNGKLAVYAPPPRQIVHYLLNKSIVVFISQGKKGAHCATKSKTTTMKKREQQRSLQQYKGLD